MKYKKLKQSELKIALNNAKQMLVKIWDMRQKTDIWIWDVQITLAETQNSPHFSQNMNTIYSKFQGNISSVREVELYHRF